MAFIKFAPPVEYRCVTFSRVRVSHRVVIGHGFAVSSNACDPEPNMYGPYMLGTVPAHGPVHTNKRRRGRPP